MSNNYITEAFKQFYLTEDAEEFQLSSSGPAESKSLIDLITGDDEDILSDVYDLEAEAKEDLKNSYLGKVILDCNVCHSNVFFDKDQITENEDGLCCAEIECPYCMSNEGYTIIGEVAPYGEVPEEPEEEPEIDIESEEVDIEEPTTEESTNEADIEEKEDEEDIDEEYLKSSEKLAPSKELSEACCKEECEDELEEGLKADKVKSLNRNDRINGRKGLQRGKGLEANDDIRGPKYKEFNESCGKKIKLKESCDLNDDQIEAAENVLEAAGIDFNYIDEDGFVDCCSDEAAYAALDALKNAGYSCSVCENEDEYTPDSVEINWAPDDLDESCLREETDLTKTKGKSIAKLIQDNHKILDNSGTKERLAAEVKRLFDEAGYETPATKKVLYNLSKARDFVSALTYIYNVFLKGSGNGVVESCDMEEACSVEEGCKCDEGYKDTIEESQEINEVAPIVAAGARMVAGAAAKSLADKAVDKLLGEGYSIEGYELGTVAETHLDYISIDLDNGIELDYQTYEVPSKDFPESPKEIKQARERYMTDEDVYNVNKYHKLGLKVGDRVKVAHIIDPDTNVDLYRIVSKVDKVNESATSEPPTVYVNNRKIVTLNKNTNWDEDYFDAIDKYGTYGPYVPKKKYIVKIVDSNGNDMPYKELCDLLLQDEYAYYKPKYTANKVNEAIEDISINTEDETMTMSSKPDGGVTIETTPKIGDLGIEDEGEMIAPLSPETEADINTAIENNTEDDEEDILGDLGIEDEIPAEDDFEDFDEESFNDLGESYLKRCYENVNSFKTTGISSQANGSFLIEGVIKFDSGNIKETQFEFIPSKKNKLKLEGYNRQISNGKKTFKLSCSVANKKLVCESLNFNYKSKNELNESVRVYGTVKRKASK